jgi:hypothetical protein
MIHDPKVEVTCDTDNCTESVFLQMYWITGGYGLKDDQVKEQLENDYAWTCIDKYTHMCKSCSEEIGK